MPMLFELQKYLKEIKFILIKMPYRRRYRKRKAGRMARKRSYAPKRRRVYKKRRYNKKRSSPRQSFGFKTLCESSKQDFGIRRYLNEIRNFGFENTANHVLFQAVCPIGTRSQIESMIKSVYAAGNIHSGIGETAVGAYESNLENYKCDIRNLHIRQHFRNVGEHAGLLEIYEISPKKSFAFPTGVSTMDFDIIDKLEAGWDQDVAAGASTATSKTGQTLVNASGSSSVETISSTLTPRQSKEFNRHYKIVKSKKYKLNVGDEVFWTTRLKSRVWNPAKIYSAFTDGVDTLDCIGGYSSCLLVRWSGCLGRSVAAGEEGVVGLMQGDIAHECVIRASLLPLQGAKNETYRTLTHLDLTGKTLGGGAEHVMTDDAN